MRRSPHGERGLKSKCPRKNLNTFESLPTRGAWIEMVYDGRAVGRWDVGRSPHGERGLKYFADLRYCRWILSLPTRGAWIEMIQ